VKRIAIAPRPDWQATAEHYGFHFHTIDGAPYWDESAYYAFTLEQIERDIEAPTEELHQLAMSLIDEIIASEDLMTKLAIPVRYWDWIADSWRQRQPHVYGRMDLVYDGNAPAKLYELSGSGWRNSNGVAFFQRLPINSTSCRSCWFLHLRRSEKRCAVPFISRLFAIAPRIRGRSPICAIALSRQASMRT
jgi:glutathionylspermidine synthase